MTDILERIDALPTPRATANATTLKLFRDALDAEGKVTMMQLESAGVVSRKTIVKHIRAGHLIGGKALVNGKPMWLFDPHHALDYLERLTGLLETAVREKRNRPTKVVAPDGYLTLTAAAAACGVSHWTLRAHLIGTGVTVRRGQRGAKLIAEVEVPALRRHFRNMVRPQARRTTPMPHEKGRQAGGIYIASFDLLWTILSTQPETTKAELTRVTGASLTTASRWLSGERLPAAEYRGAIIALFRERFRCRLAPELEEIALDHRCEYMRDLMRRKRDGACGG